MSDLSTPSKPVLAAVSRSPMGTVLRRMRRRSGRRSAETMNPATRADLCAHFAPLNRRLGAFLGRDLSAWDR